MRRSLLISVAIVLIWTAFSLTSVPSAAREVCVDSPRWDLVMIKEAPIWQKLVAHYSYADQKEWWPQRKRAAEWVLQNHPESQWADDAALILACGKASFENDPRGAVADLQKLVRRYPQGRTIVARWDAERGCTFDDTWLLWQGGLAFLDPDGTMRAAKPFDRDGAIAPLEREALAYFDHLERYPRATKVVAQLLTSQILARSDDSKGSTAALERIVANAPSYLATVSRADRTAALQPDGYYLWSLAGRPEYQAFLSLIQVYERAEAVEKSLDAADRLIQLASPDGQWWLLNQRIADFYRQHGRNDRAKAQYELALAGLKQHQDVVTRRSKIVQGSEIPDNFWRDTAGEIQRAMRAIQ